jgi:hypothetical protein
MRQAVWVLLAAMFLASCVQVSVPGTGPRPGPPRIVWSGQSGGFHVLWTTSEIQAERVASPSAPVFSEVGATIEDFHRYAAEHAADCDMVRSAQIRSLAGPVLSILEHDTLRCADGSDVSRQVLRVVDLRRPGMHVGLDDYFPSPQLGPLRKQVARFCRAVPPGLFDHFWFESVHASTVTVGIALPATCSTDRLMYALPIPAALSAALTQAAARSHGFLGRDAGRISGGLSTVVNYHYRRSG